MGPLAEILSEAGLIRQRWMIEYYWLVELVEHPRVGIELDEGQRAALERLAEQDWPELVEEIIEVEKRNRHDVRALTVVMERKLDGLGLVALKPWVHFGCTSWDVNNLAYSSMLSRARDQLLVPRLTGIQERLGELAAAHAEQPMLGRTHLQPASPTTFGKEMNVYALRISRQLEILSTHIFDGKWNGAVGNFNAHEAARPDVPWLEMSRSMVSRMELHFSAVTTQIEAYDGMVEFFDGVIRSNRILLDLAQDMSIYAGLGYLNLESVDAEVGSSTMPHKVNPIDFENAEGNLAIANSLLGCFGERLQVSRLQRDLSDSTVLRNIGAAMGHAALGWDSLLRGLGRISPDDAAMRADLDSNWQVLGEAIQTVLRTQGDDGAYEKLRAATRGKGVLDAAGYADLVRELVPEGEQRERLLALTPATYLGLAPRLANSGADGTAIPGRTAAR